MDHDQAVNEKDLVEFLSKKNSRPTLPFTFDVKS